jgi:hypothetical protein
MRTPRDSTQDKQRKRSIDALVLQFRVEAMAKRLGRIVLIGFTLVMIVAALFGPKGRL